MVMSGDSPEEHNGVGVEMRKKGQHHQIIAECDEGQKDTGELSYRTVHPGPEKLQNDTGLLLIVEIL